MDWDVGAAERAALESSEASRERSGHTSEQQCTPWSGQQHLPELLLGDCQPSTAARGRNWSSKKWRMKIQGRLALEEIYGGGIWLERWNHHGSHPVAKMTGCRIEQTNT
jgi:hypothetical protein